jgi:hypothetical protein
MLSVCSASFSFGFSVLNGPEDCMQFKAKTVASELWDLINPNVQEEVLFATKPVAPKVEQCDKKAEGRGTRSQSTQTTLEGRKLVNMYLRNVNSSLCSIPA